MFRFRERRVFFEQEEDYAVAVYPTLSVIICTHNPRDTYLARVLEALKLQSLNRESWELLIVDNASTRSVADGFDIGWHPLGRHLVEPDLGLTPARLRGISEAKSELFVFVDDDNIVNRNYLEKALRIGASYPFLGAWGGTVKAEFEKEPPAWTRPYWGHLAVREFEYPRWSNVHDDWASHPNGAGLCIRKEVAVRYADTIRNDATRRRLGRTGMVLLSHEDTDLVLTCAESGLGWGNFPDLELTHLIPNARLSEDYLDKLIEGWALSGTLLQFRRYGMFPGNVGRAGQWFRTVITAIRRGRREARFLRARQRGQRQGRALIRSQVQGAI